MDRKRLIDSIKIKLIQAFVELEYFGGFKPPLYVQRAMLDIEEAQLLLAELQYKEDESNG